MAAAPAIDPRIQGLPSTTFFGKRLTRRQIADVQEMVQACSGLSRTELAKTVCEHLHWKAGSGASRVRLATRFLEQLAEHGICLAAGQAAPATRPGPGGRSLGPHGPPAADRRRSRQPAAAAAGRRRGQAGIRRVAGVGRALPPARLPQAARLPCGLLPARPPRAPARLPAVRPRYAPAALPGRVDRLAGRALPRPSATGGAQCTVPSAALGPGEEPCLARAGAGGATAAGRLAQAPSKRARSCWKRM